MKLQFERVLKIEQDVIDISMLKTSHLGFIPKFSFQFLVILKVILIDLTI